MTTQEIFDIAKKCNGVRATIDRFEGFMNELDADNSYNWNGNYPIFECRIDDDYTFVWVANDQDCDPRCNTYLDENCVIFRNERDFIDFCDAVKQDE